MGKYECYPPKSFNYTIQKRIVRTIADADYLAHTPPLFKKFNLLKIVDLYKFQAVVDTHVKIQEGGYKENTI